MQQFNRNPLDFEAWAAAVRQQMLDSLAKRRNADRSDTQSLRNPDEQSSQA